LISKHFLTKSHNLIVGCLCRPTWKSNRSGKPLKLLCNFYNTRKIYKCGCGPHNTISWVTCNTRAAGWDSCIKHWLCWQCFIIIWNILTSLEIRVKDSKFILPSDQKQFYYNSNVYYSPQKWGYKHISKGSI
jgi:hypothetical protein